jgi:hypothetical protein
MKQRHAAGVWLQVIRLLDPHGQVFPRTAWKHHLVCVSRNARKSLRQALHHQLDINQVQRDQASLPDADDVDSDGDVDEDDLVRHPC